MPWLPAALRTAEKEQCMTQSSTLLLWVLILGHCSIPLFAFPRILMGGGRLACQDGDQEGVAYRVRGGPEALAWGSGLGVVAWSGLGL